MKTYMCPVCHNKTVVETYVKGYGDIFICEECATEFSGRENYDGSITLYRLDDEEDDSDYLFGSESIECDEDADDITEMDQEYTSEKTSINSNKLPAIFKLVDWKPGTINLDFGGGKFDNAAEYLSEYDVTNLVYDPYNRSKAHNQDVIKQIKSAGGADTATCSNVLNVIKEPDVRRNVLTNIKRLVKPTGKVFITVYEGSGKGDEGPTKSGYQLNRKTEDYLEEVKEVFPDAKRKGKLIECSPSQVNVESSERINGSSTYDEDVFYTVEKFANADGRMLAQALTNKLGVNVVYTGSEFDRGYGDDYMYIDTVFQFVADNRVHFDFPLTYYTGGEDDSDSIYLDVDYDSMVPSAVDRYNEAIGVTSSIKASTYVKAADEDDEFEFDPADFDEGPADIEDRVDDLEDQVDDIEEDVEDEYIDEDTPNIETDNNLEGHFIAECEACQGIFISALVESDQDVTKITGICPLCNKETDQYLKWIIRKVGDESREDNV